MIRNMKRYHHVVGVRGLLSAIRGKSARIPILLEMRRPEARFPFYLRVPSTDVLAFEQIFLHREYDFDIRKSPKVIVDAGANTGLASVYFANRFPGAKIIAIEPEASNFAILQKNILPYPNIVGMRVALWHENRKINLVDPALGHWGFMTQDEGGSERQLGEMVHQVQGMTLDTIMKSNGIEHIDILKVDIEGAEREVFNHSSRWLDQVDAMIVELHERLKPGCNRSFYNGTSGFDDEWWQGENVYLTRREGCLVRRSPEVSSIQ